MAPLDPFAEAFDSIPLRTASGEGVLGAPTAWERGDEFTPRRETPGHYLIDDAGGRFRIDRASGLISLKDAALLDHEPDAIHAVRLRVVEPSGQAYEMRLRLQITGPTPLVCGYSGFGGDAGARTPWRDFAAYAAAPAERSGAPCPRARYGQALAEAPLAGFDGEAALTLRQLPPLAMTQSAWSL